MSEGLPKPPPPKAETDAQPEKSPLETYVAFAKELYESGERFAFPGIDPDVYARMKLADAEHPGYTTPTDELIERFKNEGMKVVLGKHPNDGMVYILPGESDNIEEDSIVPRQLQLNDKMDERLKQLILLNKASSFS